MNPTINVSTQSQETFQHGWKIEVGLNLHFDVVAVPVNSNLNNNISNSNNNNNNSDNNNVNNRINDENNDNYILSREALEEINILPQEEIVIVKADQQEPEQ